MIIEEIASHVGAGFQRFYFVDNVFLLHPQAVVLEKNARLHFAIVDFVSFEIMIRTADSVR